MHGSPSGMTGASSAATILAATHWNGTGERRPSLGKSASLEHVPASSSVASGSHGAAAWMSTFGTGMNSTAHHVGAVGHEAGRHTFSGSNSPHFNRPPAHVELLGLEAMPRRSLTMTIPLPLFQLENAPRPVTRYLRITFIPFASGNSEGDEPSSGQSQSGHQQSAHHHHASHHHHLTQSRSRLPPSISQASAMNVMPDDFELPMSPFLGPTLTTTASSQPMHIPSTPRAESSQSSSQSWYRKIAVAAGARSLLHSHDDTGSLSLGGAAKEGGSSSGGGDWFKRIGGGKHNEESTSGSAAVPPSPATTSPRQLGSQKVTPPYVHDRCRLPGRRRSVAEAFRVTALVLADPASTPDTAGTGGVGAGVTTSLGSGLPGPVSALASHTPIVSRTVSGSSSSKKTPLAPAPDLSTTMSSTGMSLQGSSMSGAHVSPRQVQGSFPSSVPLSTNTTNASSFKPGGTGSPSLVNELEYGFELGGGGGGGATAEARPSNLASTRTRVSDSGTSTSTSTVDWSADLPEPGTFPVVLAFCDGSRARSLELVPEGWEAIGLGAGASALDLPGFESGGGQQREREASSSSAGAAAEEDDEGRKDGAIGGGPGSSGASSDPAHALGPGSGSRGSKEALPSGALGGVADLILAACAAVMDL